MSNKSNFALGQTVSWLSIILNVLLFALKLWAGTISKSVALIADAWHTLSDSVSSIAVLIGLRVADKPADEEHPFGHGRAELVASIVVAVLLAVVGFNFFVESVVRFKSQETVVFGPLAKWVTVASVVIKELMARYSIYYGKKIKSNSLVADGWHHRSDAISSIIILVGIFLGDAFWWMDALLGIGVSVMIFFTTFSIFKETISVLLGKTIDIGLKNDIIRLAAEICDIEIDPHNFLVHHYGNHSELTLHISLPGHYSLSYAHEIATSYENIIQENYGISTTIHIDALND